MKTSQTTILKAAKELDFTTNEQLYEYMIETYHNGQFSQLKKLWQKLPKDNKHVLIDYVRDNYANDKLHNYLVSLF
jgi:nucleoid-associated protein YejK